MTWIFCCCIKKANEEIIDQNEVVILSDVFEGSNQTNTTQQAENATDDKLAGETVVIEQNEQLKDFLNNLFADIKLKIQEEELNDITLSVEKTVLHLLEKLKRVQPVLKSSEIVRTGSCYDGTKILKPDEFDFLAVIDCFSIADAVTTEKCATEGFAHARCIEKRASWSPFIEQGSDFSVVACRKSKSLREIFREHFHSVILAEISKTFTLTMHTGSLILRGYSVPINGPQCSIQVLWQSNSRSSEPLEIDVDLSPAIKCSCITAILNSSDVINEEVFNDIVQLNQFFYLIPRPHPVCNTCLKMVFPQSDQHLVKSLNASHKKAFMILKYLSREMLKHNFRLKKIFNSFALKMAIFHHSFNCNEIYDSVGECLLSIASYVQEQLARDPPTMRSIFTVSRNVWKNVDLTKHELSVARDILKSVINVFENIKRGQFGTSDFNRLKEELLNACSYSISLGTNHLAKKVNIKRGAKMSDERSLFSDQTM
ncbi:cyclic GMP-AMP synthase-like [Mercenaria mercenaria]|uniref:cyclic GMP-AMP synthase-like n=1 Tax=Mercenaria mercenaria TaxID=6596 RepID=UPI00234F3775|nr:cyclic GMP-AMP synthase-like [Mercenaria mercenaria]